jgi:hypothetical protein
MNEIQRKIDLLVQENMASARNIYLVKLSTSSSNGSRRWIPYDRKTWPSLSKVTRPGAYYSSMIAVMKQHTIDPYQHVLDIGQDLGESIMWLSSITENVTGIDIDSRIIELSEANFRSTGLYQPERHRFIVLPEKSLVDADLPQWSDVDMIKIDAGERTLFVLEALVELIERNRPHLFICHSPVLNNQEIWDFVVKRMGYIGHVMAADPDRDLNTLAGTTIAYAHIGDLTDA